MQFRPLSEGSLVRLAAPHPEDHEHFARWSRNDGYLRIVHNDPARPLSAEAQADWEKAMLSDPNCFAFRLRTFADDTLIGLGVPGVELPHRRAILGIGIGDRE